MAKSLVCSGAGLLAVLIAIRMVTIQNTDQLVEIKKMDGIQIENMKIPDKEKKTTLLDNMKREEEKKKMGLDNMEYVQLDFRKLASQSQNNPPQQAGDLLFPRHISIPQMHLKRDLIVLPSARSLKTAQAKMPATIQPEQAVELKQTEQPVESVGMVTHPFGTIKNTASTGKKLNEALKDYYAAQVYGDQKLLANTAMVVRNMEDMYYNELPLPKNSLFYGVASFSGNRVIVHINKVRTSAGEFPVKYNIMDNDRIEGLYYQAPIDEVAASTADNANLNNNVSSSLSYGSMLNNVSKGAVTSAKQLLQKARSLTLEEGYSLFLMPVKKQ